MPEKSGKVNVARRDNDHTTLSCAEDHVNMSLTPYYQYALMTQKQEFHLLPYHDCLENMIQKTIQRTIPNVTELLHSFLFLLKVQIKVELLN